jgi:hypothetical protein
MTCPNCHQDAPTIVRGVRAYCTACGAPRSIATAAEAVNVAGQPAQLGGGIASVLGWLTLSVGLTLSLGVGAIVYFLSHTFFIGGFGAVVTLMVALPFLLGGRRLSKSGEDRARAVHENAVFGLAARRRGLLTVRDVAGALSLREDEADVLLTTLAKRPDGRVTLELDDDGGISYLFHDLRPANAIRVTQQPWTAPVRMSPSAPQPRVIDAELIEDDDALARAPARHASR